MATTIGGDGGSCDAAGSHGDAGGDVGERGRVRGGGDGDLDCRVGITPAENKGARLGGVYEDINTNVQIQYSINNIV